MPQKMLRPCYKQGCPNLTREKYCAAHAHLEEAEKRERAERYNKTARNADSQRLYESPEWRKLRAVYLKRNPLCERCYAEGRITPAVICDHKVEIKDGGAKLDMENITALCRGCHNKKTAAEKQKRNNRE
ncbi:MAG: HNH endonuclease [Clostridiales bacterium]|jgi:5-methylcytosine-specific restriction protein A|nr:HNH endonuclease [Clostridiales bacterium]